jgi:ribosome biogenesis GTPase
MTKSALVVKAYGRQFIVEIDGTNYQAVTKSKKTEYVVGDIVCIEEINSEQVQIVDVIKRDNLVYRTDNNRSKIIASNIDQMLIVIAVKPNCNLNFLNNCLIFAESAGITPIIIINKTDLTESADFTNKIINLYSASLGYEVISLSAYNGCDTILSKLANKNSLLIGQSGVGKSTIINQVIPEGRARTGEISKSENTGCHTTTNAELYHINNHSNIIDCPGLQEFGLYHLDVDRLIEYFPEIKDHLGECKFRNCRHLNEPGCIVKTLYENGQMDKVRFELLQSITNNLLTKGRF